MKTHLVVHASSTALPHDGTEYTSPEEAVWTPKEQTDEELNQQGGGLRRGSFDIDEGTDVSILAIAISLFMLLLKPLPHHPGL